VRGILTVHGQDHTAVTAATRFSFWSIAVVAKNSPETNRHDYPEADHEENQPVVRWIAVMFGAAHLRPLVALSVCPNKNYTDDNPADSFTPE